MSKAGDARNRSGSGRGEQGSEEGLDRGATPSAMPADDSYLNTDGRATESSGATTTSPPEGDELADAAAGGDDRSADAQAQADGAPGAAGYASRSSEAASATDEQRDKYLRLVAEYDNYRKRSIRERQEAGARAQADLVKQLIDPLDDLSRFAHVDPQSVDPATVVQGAELVERKLLKALGAAGLTVINPQDQPFDPALHEAVATEPALSREDDHMVARVYQSGYLFNGQLLRPARVVVKQWT